MIVLNNTAGVGIVFSSWWILLGLGVTRRGWGQKYFIKNRMSQQSKKKKKKEAKKHIGKNNFNFYRIINLEIVLSYLSK
jgi:hypothetical protein